MTTQSLKFPSGKQLIGLCVLLFGLVVWTFLPALQNDFINYDDDLYITGNAHVQEGLNRSSIGWAFTSIEASNWHPLTWLSHMTDCKFFGLKPWGHHLTSVLLHAINAVLLFLALLRMTGATWRSLFVAAVFGLHPLRVESVAWVAERKDVLSTMFGLLALLMYAEYAKTPKDRDSRLKTFYCLALLFFALSLMSKPMLVTLPCVLLLLDFWPLNRLSSEGIGRLAREKAPFFLLAAASCAVTYVVQKRGGAMALLAEIPFGARCENAVVSYCRYLGHLFWPDNLSVLYPVRDHWPALIVFLAAVFLFSLSAVVIAARRHYPFLLTGWLWFLGTLVPVIGLVAVGEQAMADRYSYVSSLGLLLLVVWSVEKLTHHWQKQALILSLASAAILATYIPLTRHNIGYWKNSETLFRHVIAVTADNYSAYCSLGNAMLSQGRFEEALSAFQMAAKLKPNSPENHNNVGVALGSLNRVDEAVIAFQNAVRLNPGYGQAHQNLGMAFERKELLGQATSEYLIAARLMPYVAAAHNSLGIALAKQGQLDQAIMQFQEAIQLNPGELSAQRNLKMALELKSH